MKGATRYLIAAAAVFDRIGILGALFILPAAFLFLLAGFTMLARLIAGPEFGFEPDTGIVSVIALPIAFISMLIMWAVRRSAESEIRWREETAQQFAAGLAAKLKAGETTPPFVLYLRPFRIDRQVKSQASPFAEPLAAAMRRLSLEDQVSRTVGDIGPLVCLSNEGLQAAGTIRSTDENWWGAFTALAEAAALIVMVPSSAGSTSQEFGHLVGHGLLRKAVFVLPKGTEAEFASVPPSGKARKRNKTSIVALAAPNKALPIETAADADDFPGAMKRARAALAHQVAAT